MGNGVIVTIERKGDLCEPCGLPSYEVRVVCNVCGGVMASLEIDQSTNTAQMELPITRCLKCEMYLRDRVASAEKLVLPERSTASYGLQWLGKLMARPIQEEHSVKADARTTECAVCEEREPCGLPKKETYYHTCAGCGANLDPGERCGCGAE